MSWKETLLEYIGKKYLGEIARDIAKLLQKKPERTFDQLSGSQSVPFVIYLLFLPADLEKMPDKCRSMIEKAFLQNTFIADQLNRHNAARDREGTSDLSKREIDKAVLKISETETHSSLPDLNNLLFREGLSEKEYAWQLLNTLLTSLPSLHEPAKVNGFNQLMDGKIICWDKDFLNMNFRHPELYSLYLATREFKPDRESFCRDFSCSSMEVGRQSPFQWYVLLEISGTSGLVVTFQE